MSVCSRFGSAFLLLWAAFGTALAGTIIVDTTAYLGATSIQPISCDTSQSSTQSIAASATSSCGNGLLISSASGNLNSGLAGLFPNIQANTSVQSAWNIALSDYGTASVDASYDENLVIAGGTGSGSLLLDLSLIGQGGEDGAWTGGTMSANISGGNTLAGFSGPSWTCSGEICSWGLSGYPEQYVAIPFTFGVPFRFSEDLSLNAVAGNNGSAGVSATLGVSAFSVLDSSGNVVSDAQVSDPPDAPEPGSFILCGGLLGIAAIGERKRRRRISGQRRLVP